MLVLPPAVPPPRVLGRSQLPPPAEHFTGRALDLHLLLTRLRERRLVLLTAHEPPAAAAAAAAAPAQGHARAGGVGGLGLSTLAVAAARHLAWRRAFTHGVLYLDASDSALKWTADPQHGASDFARARSAGRGSPLGQQAARSDPTRLAVFRASLARELGLELGEVAPSAPSHAAEQEPLAAALRPKHALVVLDGVEALLADDGFGRLLHGLLLAPNLHLLVVSTHPLPERLSLPVRASTHAIERGLGAADAAQLLLAHLGRPGQPVERPAAQLLPPDLPSCLATLEMLSKEPLLLSLHGRPADLVRAAELTLRGEAQHGGLRAAFQAAVRELRGGGQRSASGGLNQLPPAPESAPIFTRRETAPLPLQKTCSSEVVIDLYSRTSDESGLMRSGYPPQWGYL